MWMSVWSQTSAQMVLVPTSRAPTCAPATGATAPRPTTDTVKVNAAILLPTVFELHARVGRLERVALEKGTMLPMVVLTELLGTHFSWGP